MRHTDEELLRDFTTALEADNMELVAGKRQVLGLTRAVREAWADSGGTAVAVAKDYPPLRIRARTPRAQ